MGGKFKPVLLAGCLTLAACIDSGNRGWDLGPEPDLVGGTAMPQAWRGVHAGRIGFRCREGRVLLFVETWHPLAVPLGQRTPMSLDYRFNVAGDKEGSVEGVATSRGIEIPAASIGQGAPNDLLRRLSDDASDLVVGLPGARHGITIKFDVSAAGHAHRLVLGECQARPTS